MPGQLKTDGNYSDRTANEKESSPVCMLTLLERVSFLGTMLPRWPFSCLYPVLCVLSGYTSEINIKSGHELEHCVSTVQIFILLAQTLV